MKLSLIKGTLPRSEEVIQLSTNLVNENHPDYTHEQRQVLLRHRLNAIAQSIKLDDYGNFWIMEAMDGSIGGFILTHFYKVDGVKTCWLNHMYVLPYLKGTKFVRECINEVRHHAKANKCVHNIIMTRRKNIDVVCRFLGKSWHKYATLLKEDL